MAKMHSVPSKPTSSSITIKIAIIGLTTAGCLLTLSLVMCFAQRVQLNKEIADLKKDKTQLIVKNSLMKSKQQQQQQQEIDRSDHDHHRDDNDNEDKSKISSSKNRQVHQQQKIDKYQAPRSITQMNYRVVVFTYLRPEGLKRILRSLQNAYYPAQATVSLNILLDYPKPKKLTDPTSMEDRKVTLELINNFKWTHGPFVVHRRQGNVGLKRNILESWYPSSQSMSDNRQNLHHDKNEVCILLEDDIEVSPFWFDWATASVEKYYFQTLSSSSSGYHDRLLGVSLYRPIHDEQSHKKCTVNSNNHEPFLLQQPCSWGAIYFPKPWKAFRDWYDEFEATGEEPIVRTERGEEPDANSWAKSSSWKKYLIRFMHEQGWAMVYPNLPDTLVYSTNHLMKGEHPTPNRKLFELPLLDEEHAKKIWPEKSRVVEKMMMVATAGAAGEEHEHEHEHENEQDSSNSHENDYLSILEDGAHLPGLEEMKCFDVMFNEEKGGVKELLQPKKNLASHNQHQHQHHRHGGHHH